MPDILRLITGGDLEKAVGYVIFPSSLTTEGNPSGRMFTMYSTNRKFGESGMTVQIPARKLKRFKGGEVENQIELHNRQQGHITYESTEYGFGSDQDPHYGKL